VTGREGKKKGGKEKGKGKGDKRLPDFELATRLTVDDHFYTRIVIGHITRVPA